MNSKFKVTAILFVFVIIRAGDSMPQGFFSQGLSIPKLVSWNSNERTLTILPNLKVSGVIKNSPLNVFGKKNTVDKKPKQDYPPINDKFEKIDEEFKAAQTEKPDITKLTYPEEKAEKNNDVQDVKLPNDLQGWGQLTSKFSGIDDNADKQTDEEITTESVTETTTDDSETTTLVYVLDIRISDQAAATLLG